MGQEGDWRLGVHPGRTHLTSVGGQHGVCLRGVLKPLWQLLPDWSCPLAQAADSDYEESDNFVGPGGDFDLTAHPQTTQENGHTPEGPRLDITTYGDSNLLAEPQKVNKIEIQYAKTAKKMDMKKLKQSMWSLLTEISRTEADTKANHNEPGKEEAPAEVAGEKLLSGLTQNLQRSLPPLMAQNLSIPLAFACLLHLANEKNLKLEGTEDLSDVLVRQGE